MKKHDDKTLRVCAIGDIMGRAGRRCLDEWLPLVKERYAPDLLVVNGENAAGGFGLTKKIFHQMTREWGVHAVTTGNHWHDKKEIYSFADDYPNLLLPANMYNVAELQQGYCIVKTPKGPCAIINLIGRVFMKGQNRCPFQSFTEICKFLPKDVTMKIVDFHGEATSEKQAFGHYTKGLASLVYGTHTHCPTADARILGAHTGYLTDVGMTGAYDSVIGIQTETSLAFFLHGEKKKFEPAKLDPWLCGLIADIDSETGRCLAIERFCWQQKDIKNC